MRTVIVGLCALALCAAVAPVADGSEWRTAQLPGEAAKVPIFGISCPSTRLCVAVGGNNTVASSTNPTGGAPAWQVVYAGKGAVPTGPNASIGYRQVRGISCPSPGLCVAGTFEGDIYTATEPTGEASGWTVTDIDEGGPNTHIYGVSCPTPALCVAVAGGGKIVTSTNPTGGSSAWTTTQLLASLELRGVSCASPSFCVAVGNEGLILSSTSPTGGAGAWTQVLPAVGNGNLFGISCAAPLCVTGNTGGNLITSVNPLGAPPSWKTVDGAGSVQITAASCVSASRCAVVDNNGDVLTSTNPSGGADDWTFTNVLPFPGVDGTSANHFFGISCASASFCGVAANDGQVLVSSNPFEADPAPQRRRRPPRRGPKRPRVKIATGPRGILIARHRKATAQFRFFALHHAPVRGFLCRLDGRRMKRCRSPKRYRVGPGWHRFRVRAIGRTGLRGPIAKALFRVFARSEWPPHGRTVGGPPGARRG
jgi:hypothetical protein